MTTSSAVDVPVLLAVTILFAIALPVRSADKAVNPDEELLAEMRVGTDNASLFAFLRSRSTAAEKVPDLDRLIRQLGSDVFKERESAAAALLALEGKALASVPGRSQISGPLRQQDLPIFSWVRPYLGVGPGRRSWGEWWR